MELTDGHVTIGNEEESGLYGLEEPPSPLGGSAPRGGLGWRWFAQRALAGVLVMLAVSVLVFAATEALPGNPAQQILGREATPARVHALELQLHLNQPLPQEYIGWLGRIVRLNFGTSLSAQEPVNHLIGAPLVNSLFLLFLVAIISIPLSVLLGVFAAAKRDGKFDNFGLFTSLLTTAMPDFVIGLLLVFVFSTTVLKLLPSVALIPPGSHPWQNLNEMVLPVAALVLLTIPFQFRLVRTSMIEALASEYVAAARLRGVPEPLVLRRHALPNALVPMVQASALTLSYLLGGVVIIEYVFNYPGLGSLLQSSISVRDMPVIQAVVLVFTAGVVFFNLVADALTVLLTPRLRTGGVR